MKIVLIVLFSLSVVLASLVAVSNEVFLPQTAKVETRKDRRKRNRK